MRGTKERIKEEVSKKGRPSEKDGEKKNIAEKLLESRVADPYTLYTDPDPAFSKIVGSGSGSWIRIRILDPDPDLQC